MTERWRERRENLPLSYTKEGRLFHQDSDYQILKLSNLFYSAYPNPLYREILQKHHRAYACLLFQTRYDYFICIPFRSEIQHSYAYHFKSSKRSRAHKSGLDYTKIVIVRNSDYIDDEIALVDKDEFKETMINMDKIKKGALEFVEAYISHEKGIKCLHEREYKRRYQYSTLQYFREELKI